MPRIPWSPEEEAAFLASLRRYGLPFGERLQPDPTQARVIAVRPCMETCFKLCEFGAGIWRRTQFENWRNVFSKTLRTNVDLKDKFHGLIQSKLRHSGYVAAREFLRDLFEDAEYKVQDEEQASLVMTNMRKANIPGVQTDLETGWQAYRLTGKMPQFNRYSAVSSASKAAAPSTHAYNNKYQYNDDYAPVAKSGAAAAPSGKSKFLPDSEMSDDDDDRFVKELSRNANAKSAAVKPRNTVKPSADDVNSSSISIHKAGTAPTQQQQRRSLVPGEVAGHEIKLTTVESFVEDFDGELHPATLRGSPTIGSTSLVKSFLLRRECMPHAGCCCVFGRPIDCHA
jgi:hypothetical protein